MKAVLLEVPEGMLAERRAAGLDVFDEMWDGVLHMVPPAAEAHQAVAAELFGALLPVARACGLVARFETGLFRRADDYRVPDQLYRRPDQGSARGAESAELVVEILSPNDETYEKVDWYGVAGVREVLVIEPVGRTVELFRSVEGRMSRVEGPCLSEVLDVTFETVDGALRVTGPTGVVDV